MAGIYIVNCVNSLNHKVISEIFPGFKAARECAVYLASKYVNFIDHKTNFIQKNDDVGSPYWKVLYTDNIYIVISFRKIPKLTNTIVNDNKDQDETYRLILDIPGGFDLNNKPMTIQDVINAPNSVKSTVCELTDHQKWALTIARIRRIPNYTITVNNTTYDQQGSLKELQLKSNDGFLIRDDMCVLLDGIIYPAFGKN
jgi:hypothetical protein